MRNKFFCHLQSSSCRLSCAQILPSSDWELTTRALVQCSVAPSPKVSNDTRLHSKIAIDHKDNCHRKVQLHEIQLPNGIVPNLTWNRASEWCRSSSSSEGTWHRDPRSEEPSTSTLPVCAHARPAAQLVGMEADGVNPQVSYSSCSYLAAASPAATFADFAATFITLERKPSLYQKRLPVARSSPGRVPAQAQLTHSPVTWLLC